LSVLGIFVLIAVALIVVYKVSTPSGGAPSGQPVAAVKCETGSSWRPTFTPT
jgi:hypothetical protein